MHQLLKTFQAMRVRLRFFYWETQTKLFKILLFTIFRGLATWGGNILLAFVCYLQTVMHKMNVIHSSQYMMLRYGCKRLLKKHKLFEVVFDYIEWGALCLLCMACALCGSEVERKLEYFSYLATACRIFLQSNKLRY